jgi:hypothetical protein
MLRAANIGEACDLFGSQRHFGTRGVFVACPAALEIKAMVLWLSRYRLLPANVIERKRFATRTKDAVRRRCSPKSSFALLRLAR